MARSSKQTSESTPKTAEVVSKKVKKETVTEVVAESPVPDAPKKKSSKKQVQEAPVQETPVEQTTDSPTEDGKKRTRRSVSRDTVLTDIDRLLADVETELNTVRSEKNGKGSRFLRSLSKNLRVVRNDAARVMKVKKTSTRDKNSNPSGFMKPSLFTKELASFTGWDLNEPRSRCDVTRHLCSYIKDKELQNPKNRREIVPDAPLRKLLKLSEDQRVTYPSLQQHIQHLFKKAE